MRKEDIGGAIAADTLPTAMPIPALFYPFVPHPAFSPTPRVAGFDGKSSTNSDVTGSAALVRIGIFYLTY